LLFFVNGNIGFNATTEQGLFIMTDTGDLVFGVGYMASHFQLQTLNDDPVFTYRECSGGAEEDGAASSGYGKVEIFNDKYHGLYTIRPNLTITLNPGQKAPPCLADVRESILTEDGTMIVTVYNRTQTDLSSVGGHQAGWVQDPLAVEINPV